MIVPPKGLVNLAVGAMSEYMAHRLRRANPGHAAQRHVFGKLTHGLAMSAFGRETGIEPEMAYETFRTRVTPRTYEMLVPYIERMKAGASGVLWPGRCPFFALSAGTAGRARYIPVNEEMLAHFRKAGLHSLLYYAARVGHTGVLRGRHLLLGGTAHLTPLNNAGRQGPFAGDLSAIAAVNIPAWIEKHLYEPGPAIAQLGDWPAKLQAIAERVLHRDITLLAGMPNWILALGEVLRAGTAPGHTHPPRNLKALWPNLECYVHGGVPVAPFADELRVTLGPDVNFHEVYPTSEGIIAAQDADAASGLRLIVNAGLFFEFLPMTSFDQENLAHLGTKVVPLEGVRTGVDYALLLTTPGGLCRYVVGDVVRFLATDVPRLIYVGRTDLRLNAFGENVIEQEVTDALVAVCRRHGWSIVNLHVAPIFANTLTGQLRGGHEWWVELKVPTIETPTANVLSPELDAALMQRNGEYRTRRNGKVLESPVIRLVMPGVFEQWMKRNGRWGGHNKTPRCRSDRVVADQLAELSRFYIEAKPPYFIRRH